MLSGCSQPIQIATTYPLTQLDSATVADFGDLHAMGLHFCDYTASSRGLTTANWGNCIIRTATRRRHADSRLLVLPNPLRYRCGESRRDRRARPLGPWAVAGPGRRPRAQPAAWPRQTTRRPEHRWRHKQHDAPRHAETPPRGCGTGLSLPSRV